MKALLLLPTALLWSTLAGENLELTRAWVPAARAEAQAAPTNDKGKAKPTAPSTPARPAPAREKSARPAPPAHL